jgi:cell division protein FtsN
MASKDYKARPATQAHYSARSGGGGGFLPGLFIGFLLGLGLASGIAVYFFKSPLPFVDRTKSASDKGTVPGKEALKDAKDSKDGKPRFDFYRILPGQEEPVTEKQVRDATKAAAKGNEVARDNYFLQAGSFQNPADADNLKARLAIIGAEALVMPSDLGDKGVWYRVRLGPYNRIEDIDRVRGQLAQNGIQASLVRIKDSDAQK